MGNFSSAALHGLKFCIQTKLHEILLFSISNFPKVYDQNEFSRTSQFFDKTTLTKETLPTDHSNKVMIPSRPF